MLSWQVGAVKITRIVEMQMEVPAGEKGEIGRAHV